MKKFASLLYGTICYLIFLASILYAIGFTGNILVPKSLDGEPRGSLAESLFINASLLILFALQHSVMARPGFKQWWIRIVPRHLERSTYVLLASLCLLLLMWQWRPIGGVVWSIENQTIQTILMVMFFTGWALVFVSTFLINHFDLFGLRQVWLNFTGKPYKQLTFRTPVFYRFVRHPLYLGFVIAFWSVPVMTIAHLVFTSLTTVYILIAIQLEEKDLKETYGDTYRKYKKEVPMIVPFVTVKK